MKHVLTKTNLAFQVCLSPEAFGDAMTLLALKAAGHKNRKGGTEVFCAFQSYFRSNQVGQHFHYAWI